MTQSKSEHGGSRSTVGRGLNAVVMAGLAAAAVQQPSAADAKAAPIATARLDAGIVQGITAAGITSFKGVPFAQPPVGDLRWRDARPARHWEGVKIADRSGPACIQPTSAQDQAAVPSSEDCLYLNVWTGASSSAERRPVMVWIYGGGFTMGSNALPAYDGAALARKGAVVVTLNYRLGTLGFLSHPDLASESPHGTSGNYALSDLVAGLNWVKANAVAFGGDPANVTVFGESAGSHMVSYLMASPTAKGLFHRAIGQSGSIFHPAGPAFPILTPRLEAEAAGRAYGKTMGADTIAELRRVPAAAFADQAVATIGTLPTIDGYYLASDLQTIFGQGRQNDVPLLTGWNSQEGTFFPFMWKPLADQKVFQAYSQMAGPDRAAFLKLYPANTPAEALRSAITHIGDRTIAVDTWSWAEHQTKSGRAKVYVYYFSRPTRAGWVRASAPELGAEEFGATHGGENAYVFENLGLDDATSTGNAGDVRIANLMASYWVNFARNGNPNGPDLPAWPEYDAGAQARVMQFDDTAAPIPTPGLERLKLLDRIMSRPAH